jgi:predicted TPR repeat methyltransferase
MASLRQPSTVLHRASNQSSKGCLIERRRSLRQCWRDSGIELSHHLDVLDAGCGTGLCGAIVAPYARRLVGVDLSEGMLVHATSKNVYDSLIKAELTEYLRGTAKPST